MTKKTEKKINLLTEAQKQQVNEAAQRLKQGGIVAFPTETVYGLGADATNLQAIQRVYTVKQRPRNHPVIVHLSHFEEVREWAKTVSSLADCLMKHFWPGPLTLILPRAENVLDAVTGGQDTVALRMPAHPIALALLEKTERALIAPSANRFGRVSPTHSDHVKADLGKAVDFIIEGGRCNIGIESTILDISAHEPRILRLGAISASQIERVIEKKLTSAIKESSIRVPGALAKHYSPQTPLSIVPTERLRETILSFLEDNQSIAVLSHREALLKKDAVVWFQMPSQPQAYMKALYHTLFIADEQKCDRILVESLPLDEDWWALRDRLERAAHSSD